jgi:hypothetical protein
MSEEREPGIREVLGVWALFAAVGAAICVTYARLPAEDLYHVSRTGLEGGLSRVVVFTNWPLALVAPALGAMAAARIGGRAAAMLAVVGAVLCAAVAVPGVVDQSDLDARPANAPAAVGVGLAVALTVAAWRRRGIGRRHPLGRGDAVRLGVVALLGAAAIPWIAAELGFFLDGVPVIGSVFLTGEVVRDPGGTELLPAVHLGDHHGLVGVLLAASALLLSRPLFRLQPGALRSGLSAYFSLMLAYGLTLAVQDFWFEQLVKRGTTSHAIPSVIRPAASPTWAAILVAAAAIHFAFGRIGRVRPKSERRSP